MSARDKESFPINWDRSSIAGDGTTVGTVGVNVGKAGTAVVFGTCADGCVSGFGVENMFRMSGLTGPPADCSILSLSSFLSSIVNTTSITAWMFRSSNWEKSVPSLR